MDKLKNSIKNDIISFGTWIQIPHPSIIEIIAYNCGGKLDWICIDMEHGAIDIESMSNLIRIIDKYDITPVVRIPKNDLVWIHRSLDAGARGLIIPMVNNSSDASNVVSNSFYPPIGERSYGYSIANLYGSNFNDYTKTINDEISVILQIEHVRAIHNLPDILNVKNFDGTFIGPYDLSGSLGEPGNFDSEQYINYLSYYKSMSEVCEKPYGIHIIRPTKNNIQQAVEEGYKIIAIGIDVVFLEEKCKNIIKFF